MTASTLDFSFIRRVVRFGKHGCIIILYSDEMISMIRNFCCNQPVATVIGVNKTYNLSKAFLIILSFEHPGIRQKSTCCPPILYGPIAIHSSSNVEVFSELFSALRLALKITEPAHISKWHLGLMQKKALFNSIEQTFYGASHFLCTKHIKDYVKEKIRSINQVNFDNKKIAEKILGSSGLFTHNDLKSFHIAWDVFLITVKPSNDFTNYCNSTLYPALLEGVVKPSIKTGIKNWTNNNAEFINHAIKHVLDWKKVSLMQLISNLSKLVSSQLENIKQALFGFGDFVLAPNWNQYAVSKNQWKKMSTTQQQLKLNMFLEKRKGMTGRMKCSTDGKLTINHGNQSGKKPFQRTRPKANKTKSFSKQLI